MFRIQHSKKQYNDIIWQYHDKKEWINFPCNKLCNILTDALNNGSHNCIIDNADYDLVNGVIHTRFGIDIHIRYLESCKNIEHNVKKYNTNELCRFYNTPKGCCRGNNCKYKH